jgi:hypothetical protein
VALEALLGRAGHYVRQFEADFAAVITDELYDQNSISSPRTFAHRQLRSEMLFMRLPGQGLSWLTARSVLEVDGRTVPDSQDRLADAIKGAGSGLVERLRSVADEGARFNLGNIRRNFNDPNLALLLLDPDYQPRFSFRLGKEEEIDGLRTRKATFKETWRPTVIKQNTGKDLFTTGSAWIAVEDGVVVVTELSATTDTDLEMAIRVDYRRDPKLQMWIPARMAEHYRWHRELVDCVATYSNPRRFGTSGRLIVK